MRRFFLFIVGLAVWCNASANVSPLDYGLREAKTGEERYWVLYNAHHAALKQKTNVDYSEVGDIFIAIPKDFKYIPLTSVNDFCGITITVDNTVGACTIFRSEGKVRTISVSNKQIDEGDFRNITELNKGKVLLVISDSNPWVNNRKGFNYGAIRKDILLLENGVSKNSPIMPYDNGSSEAECNAVTPRFESIIVRNLNIIRTDRSTFKSLPFRIEGQNDVRFENLDFKSPWDTGMLSDRIISVRNSTHVVFKNVRIDGTYSTKEHSGYGIELDNIWDLRCYNVTGDANWGVFDCNNMNRSYLKSCNLNRFDTHCYGRDVEFVNCYMHDYGFHNASVFGTIRYNGCTLTNYVISSIRTDYSCHVPYDLEIIDCVLNVTKDKNYIVGINNVAYNTERRRELQNKCFPNIKIHGLKIVVDNDVNNIYLFRLTQADDSISYGYLNKIDIRRLEIKGDARFNLCNKTVNMQNTVKYKIKEKGKNRIKGSIQSL